MSFDLAVWKSEKRLTQPEALGIYKKLCEDEVTSDVCRDERLMAFGRELLVRWPYDEDRPEDCPFEDPYPSEAFAILNIAWSQAEDVGPKVVTLALKHGLVCFDPQGGEVHQPGQSRRPWWRFWG